jgi:hypothetical protein
MLEGAGAFSTCIGVSSVFIEVVPSLFPDWESASGKLLFVSGMFESGIKYIFNYRNILTFYAPKINYMS